MPPGGMAPYSVDVGPLNTSICSRPHVQFVVVSSNRYEQLQAIIVRFVILEPTDIKQV